MITKLSPNFTMGRKGNKPEIIVIHIMDGSLKGTDEWFANPISQVSSHYGVGLNGEIHQYVHDEDTAWANGQVINPASKFVLSRPKVNPNLYSLSIEHEGHDLSKAPQQQLWSTVALIRLFIVKYGIPCDREHIIGHNEIKSTKPNCPSPDHSIIDKIIAMVNPPSEKEKTKTEIIRLVNTL